jgi:KaiC/GvpD/RAD55 family RecA-like ATPase
LKKEAYAKYASFIDLKSLKDTAPELGYIYHALAELMDNAETDVSLDELQAFFNAKYPDANTEVYQGLFNDINAAEIGEAVGHKILSEIKQREGLRKLSELAFAATQGRATLQDVLSATEAVKAENPQGPSNEEAFVTTDLEEIVNGTIATNGIRWRLNCLNASLGSLRKGDFGFTFARPETGKTTFVADLAANAFNQVSDPVVWFNNEEVGSKVMLRVYQSYFGVDLQTLMGKAAYFKAEFQRRVGRKFLLLDNATIDKTTIEKVLAREKPSLIIYDQIDKIKGFKADRDDLVYGAIYQWARELAKTYAPSIGVCQADGTAEGQKWLTMANVANAKTSKQAEADWILGIGKTHNQAEEYVRYLNISKNKLTGDVDSDPAQRHGHFEVIIQPTIARYKDVRNDWTKK